MGSSKVIFHVGYHKTASSLLQKNFFSNEHHGFISGATNRNEIVEAFVAPAPLQGVSQQKLNNLQQKVRNISGDKTIVFSHERLAGYPASGGFDQEIIARRMKECFPEAQIIMVIREQKDMIKSMYLQYISDGGSLSLHKYLSGVDRKLYRKPQFIFEYYDYLAALRMYQKYFGFDNVLCLPYEMLKYSPGTFLNAITKFCDIDEVSDAAVDDVVSSRVNPNRSYVELSIRRFANKLFRTQLSDYGFQILSNAQLTVGFKRISKYFPKWIFLTQYQDGKMKAIISEKVGDRYARSNIELSELIGFDLDSYGYDVYVSD